MTLVATTKKTVVSKKPLTGAWLKKLLGRLMDGKITNIRFTLVRGETIATFMGDLKESMELLESYPDAIVMIKFINGININFDNPINGINISEGNNKEEIEIEVKSNDIAKSEKMATIIAETIKND